MSAAVQYFPSASTVGGIAVSSQFRPLAIPPGVLATATKKMNSSNYSRSKFGEVEEGQLMPVVGQLQYSYGCQQGKGHTWVVRPRWHLPHLAYLCRGEPLCRHRRHADRYHPEQRPDACNFPTGGYGDGVYGGPQIYATAAFTTSSPNILMAPNPGTVFPGDAAYNVTTSPASRHGFDLCRNGAGLTANAGGAVPARMIYWLFALMGLRSNNSVQDRPGSRRLQPR